MILKLHLFFIVLCFRQLCMVFGQSFMKSSLTFVIDDTSSMHDDIEQVKNGVNEIFDAVMNTSESQIENFILVTFNDPDTSFRTATRDRDEFKRSLASISVNGGGDCPEFSMSGIERALQESLPASYLYVFTDASSKDYKKFESVKSLAGSKGCQVVFVLTGRCNYYDSDVKYKVYRQLANATSGEVFHLMKDEIGEILKYVVSSIKGRTTKLESKKFAPGYGHHFNFTVGIGDEAPTVSVTGTKPVVKVTGPGGIIPKTEVIVDTDTIRIVEIKKPTPGEHIAEVGSKTETTAVVKARTHVTFRHGFSTFKPSSINDTATKPIRGEESFLSIELNGDIQLRTVKILDMDKNPINEIPFGIVDSKHNLYVTQKFTPPNTMFRIAILGYDPKSNTTMTRFSMTPVEPQNPEVVKIENKAPTVTITGAPKINTEYDERLSLKCRVSAYPKPDIIWEDKDTGAVLSDSVSLIEFPYEYMVSLDLEKVNKNGTYQCKASNSLGTETQKIDVETKRKIYFNVLEEPKDTIIKYNTKGEIFCKIDSNPPAIITWLKNGKEFLSENKDYDISPDGSTMTINNMMPHLAGIFLCEAKNEHHREIFHFSVAISGLARPVIDKSISEVHLRTGFDVNITCSLKQGIPKPTIRWFYKALRSDTFSEYIIFKNRQNVTLGNTHRKMSGTYKCVAKNIIGKDQHETDLIMEYPPRIKKDHIKSILVKEGDKITLNCAVDAVPTAVVTWLKDYDAISNKSHIYSDHTLSLKVNLNDSGIYICIARNEYGAVRKYVKVKVYVPVSIEIPHVTTRNIKIGESTILPCHANGYPEPDVKWLHYSLNSTIPPKLIKSKKRSLMLLRVQLKDQGFYTCEASNIGGSENITYQVVVHAPPIIKNMYRDKTFKVVEGDIVLRIECNAQGSPVPSITWTMDGYNIAAGSPWYDIDNGTLMIKKIDKKAEGTYRCEARNPYGVDYETYRVEVESYPKLVYPMTTLLLEKGAKAAIKCDIAHQETDLLRWYKNGVLITIGELVLNKVTPSEYGVYTCRVSNFFKSRSRSTRINVGYKPRFLTEEEEYIDFAEGIPAYLSCDADGEPTPQVTWWHNNKKVNISVMTYEFTMKIGDQGQYICNVSNNFGHIIRQFNLTSGDCFLDIDKDFTRYQPLMVTPSGKFPKFENLNGIMFIPRGEYIIFSCPKRFTKFPTSYISAFCDGGKNMIINGNTYDYSDLQCTEELEPRIRQTGRKCLPGNTETVKVLYEMLGETLEVYEVCLDKDYNVPLYAKHNIHRSLADVAPNNTKWINTDLLKIDFEQLYGCNHQTYSVSIILGKWFHRDDNCCFNKRQLVNPRDVFPGVSQKATYMYLNVIPQWSTCNTENWNDVERRVRGLAKSTFNNLIVWTGSSGQLTLPNTLTQNVDIQINDEDHGQQPVSQYLWKVIQDPATRSSLAIIQINIPDVTPSEAYKYIRCKDICNSVSWMNNTKWYDVKGGFTYCCAIDDFKRAFDYEALFERDMENVLYDVSLLPESSLI